MTCEEPRVSLTGKYPMGKAAELLGVHRNTLRRYADAGLIRCGVRRTGRGDRYIRGAELLRFWRTM